MAKERKNIKMLTKRNLGSKFIEAIMEHNSDLYHFNVASKDKCEGGAGPDKKMIMMSCMYATNAKLVVETGFNFGGMAATMAEGLELTKGRYVGFEIREGTKPTLELLKTVYSNIDVVYGDSKVTVPEFFSKNDKCDVFFVDGQHDKVGLQTDLKHALQYTRKNGIIMIDDVDSLRPWVAELIPENECIWFQHTQHNGPGSCIYQVK